FRVCMAYLNDHEKAQDVLQETFIAVWQNLKSFRNEANISTWIFRIATNNCLKAINKLKRVQFTEIPHDLPQAQEENKESELNYLYQCIADMEETDRIIISLVLEELPQAEIASIVGLSEGNVRVKIHRIRTRLAEKFKAYGQFR
ncbi:MAG: RNA polymerase sigma factor, partial [Flavisolibacter sp.]